MVTEGLYFLSLSWVHSQLGDFEPVTLCQPQEAKLPEMVSRKLQGLVQAVTWSQDWFESTLKKKVITPYSILFPEFIIHITH